MVIYMDSIGGEFQVRIELFGVCALDIGIHNGRDVTDNVEPDLNKVRVIPQGFSDPRINALLPRWRCK
jgi:hypothetical protein